MLQCKVKQFNNRNLKMVKLVFTTGHSDLAHRNNKVFLVFNYHMLFLKKQMQGVKVENLQKLFNKKM